MPKKATGMVRKIDALGRVCIPKELKTTMGWEDQESLEIFVENKSVVLQKYQPGCLLCDTVENLISFKGKQLCKVCFSELASLYQ